MKIAIISNEFPPLMSSGSVQVRDLANDFVELGHEISVFTSTYGQDEDLKIESSKNLRILRFRSLKTKEINYFKRTINEILTPYMMLSIIKKSSIAYEKYDAVIWYSPTIFLSPIASYIKKVSECPGYLILRDIFPDWAVDTGIIGKGLPYLILKIFEKYQYYVADIIGVQAKGNLAYFKRYIRKGKTKIEVLNNWLSHSGKKISSIEVSKTSLFGRKIFIYAGNMGVAQGIDILFELVLNLRDRKDIGFLFVGRGSEMERFREDPIFKSLDNVLFFDQIDADEIPSLYSQCDVGMLSLDVRHKTHNIPGKFLSYIASGLPVLASVNPGNDIINLINSSRTGQVIDDGCPKNLTNQAIEIIKFLDDDKIKERCTNLSKKLFQPRAASKQIINSINNIK